MYVHSYTYRSPLPWRPASGARAIPLPVMYVRRGLGATPSPWNTVGAGITSGATMGAATAQSTGSIAAGAVTGGLMTTAGILAAIPGGQIPAAVVAGIASLVAPIASMFKGCGVTCQQTTDIANKVAEAAGQITHLYWGQSVRTVSMQKAAVQSLQELYGYLIQNCQAIGGQGGQQCIADRQPGGRWDFQAQQIAPIINDTAVVPDPVPPASSVLTSFGLPATVGGVSLSDWLLPAALLGAAALVP